MWVDAHCHLTDAQFADDCASVIARAQDAGVAAIITAGVDVASSRAALELAERYAGVYAVVGIQPEFAATGDGAAIRAIRELATHRRVVGIGEIGLDFYWAQNPPREIQARVFAAQLDLAAELGKPVVIHDRDAHDSVMAHLNARRGQVRGVLHCFSGDLAMARTALELDYWISLGGTVTFKNAVRTQNLATALPLERIVLETDAPYLSPWRGKRNEPAHIARIAAKIAELKQLAPAQVAAATTQNCRRLFGVGTAE